jgi:hypothetical protein
MTGTAEISAAVTDEIASWKRVFANRANGVNARALLRNAARELWSVLAIDATVHPEMKGVAHQEIVDALHDMAESAAIPADDAQWIFTQYFKAPEEKNKTRGKRKSNDHKANKLVGCLYQRRDAKAAGNSCKRADRITRTMAGSFQL